MAKTKTLEKQSKLETKFLKVYEPFKSDALKNAPVVIETLLDCIKSNDLDSFKEVLAAHLMTVNKVELARKSGLGRSTIYDLIDPKKDFNPELNTISALISALAA